MSSSVLGLGAATLGAMSEGMSAMSGVIKPKKQKLVKAPQPSAEDYMKGYINLLMGNTKATEEQRVAASFGKEGVLGASGQFYYGQAPTKIPEGSVVVQGPGVQMQGRTVNAGSYNYTMPTYQILQAQGMAPAAPKTSLYLGRTGSEDVLNRGDIKYAMKQGATRQEIKQAVKERDIKMSAKAKAKLFKNSKKEG